MAETVYGIRVATETGWRAFAYYPAYDEATVRYIAERLAESVHVQMIERISGLMVWDSWD